MTQNRENTNTLIVLLTALFEFITNHDKFTSYHTAWSVAERREAAPFLTMSTTPPYYTFSRRPEEGSTLNAKLNTLERLFKLLSRDIYSIFLTINNIRPLQTRTTLTPNDVARRRDRTYQIPDSDLPIESIAANSILDNPKIQEPLTRIQLLGERIQHLISDITTIWDRTDDQMCLDVLISKLCEEGRCRPKSESALVWVEGEPSYPLRFFTQDVNHNWRVLVTHTERQYFYFADTAPPYTEATLCHNPDTEVIVCLEHEFIFLKVFLDYILGQDSIISTIISACSA